ncbi:MAG: hypothetical protein NTX50_29930 [Candidatus Sumerlaeota bacterium]|nr:hypothetical protein [Candidatus Sumerlaeota bacterium]
MNAINEEDSGQHQREQLLMLMYLAQGEDSYRTKPPIPHSKIKRLFTERHTKGKDNS